MAPETIIQFGYPDINSKIEVIKEGSKSTMKFIPGEV